MGSSKLAINFMVFLIVFGIAGGVMTAVVTGTDTGSSLLHTIGLLTLAAVGILALLLGLIYMFSGKRK